MSRTSTTTTRTTTLQRSGSTLLSPTKRVRLSRQHPNNDIGSINSVKSRPSEKEIWEWTLTTATATKCYVRDAMTMSGSSEGFDFFWLGSVPCRRVEICGLVVGIQVFEKKVVYSIDDGTGVIDCFHRPPQPPQPTELKKTTGEPKIPPPPRPMSRIGGLVHASGRVQLKHETRIMIVDTIVSSSCGAQLTHWKTVRLLHATEYTSSEPFVIPVVPETPRKAQVTNAATNSESTSRNVILSQSTITSSPVMKPPSPHEPKLETQAPQLPVKLRHPSRLHSHQLTDTAFRLYVKYILDNAPEDSTPTGDAPEDPDTIDSDSDSDLKELYAPTRTFTSTIFGTSATPHAQPLRDSTPHYKAQSAIRKSSLPSVTQRGFQGFTLSYLRRIPELSFMAKRVIKQRIREQEKKAREAAKTSTSKSSSNPIKRVRLDRTTLASKKKRLFQWAICELLREGSIVLWDGPKRIYSPPSDHANATLLWQLSSTNTTDSSLFSNANGSTSMLDDDDELEMSDPEPDEEAYASTKPEILTPFVADALKALALAPQKRVLKRNELDGGSTKEEILANLRRDDKWAFIGEWNVDEALEYMEREELVWRVASDRWLLTQ